MTPIEALLKREKQTFDNMEPESAPSGEWAEYNVPYISQENYVFGIESAKSAIGACSLCEYFDSGMKDYCRRLNITASPEWYCGDYKEVVSAKDEENV